MNNAAYKDKKHLKKKRIAVSEKRQITIPIDFYKTLGIEGEVYCQLHDDAIVIRPAREVSGEFDEQILADLIAQGYSGQELLNKFKETRRKVPPAVKGLLNEAELAAEGNSEYKTYEDLFETEDDNE